MCTHHARFKEHKAAHDGRDGLRVVRVGEDTQLAAVARLPRGIEKSSEREMRGDAWRCVEVCGDVWRCVAERVCG